MLLVVTVSLHMLLHVCVCVCVRVRACVWRVCVCVLIPISNITLLCCLWDNGATLFSWSVCLCSQQSHFWQEMIRQIVQVAMDSKLLMTVYFEEHLEESLEGLKKEWNLRALPPVT